MDLKLKDILAVGVASIFLFPMVLIISLLVSGKIHINYGPDKNITENFNQFLDKYKPAQDSSDARQSKLYQANKKKESELKERENQLNKEMERLENLKAEISNIKRDTKKHRDRIEKLVGQSRNLSNERLEELANVYSNMKPAEAAPILLSLKDDAISKILRKIPEPRKQGKIMAALGAMDNERAAKITKILGWKYQD